MSTNLHEVARAREAVVVIRLGLPNHSRRRLSKTIAQVAAHAQDTIVLSVSATYTHTCGLTAVAKRTVGAVEWQTGNDPS